jgi:hypothetical protein
VKGVFIVLEAAEMQKTSIKNAHKQIFASRVKQNEDSLMNKPMTPPQPSLPTISPARTSGNKMGADGLLDVAAMKWQRIQV